MQKKEIKIEVTEFAGVSELRPEIQKLVKEAISASKDAYTPYSKFNVGSAVLLENGEIISGSNQENAAYPSGLCAERVVMFYANAKYPQAPIKAIAIVAKNSNSITDEPVPPCGACRQSLIESEQRFNNKMEVYLVGHKKIQMVKSIADLLPLTFTGDFL
ncbi:MAG: cytidine deaminase [Bacteroidetes bacterium GWF2_38_335]|nr:MAG: cytidine deaminase [Bacteroidetes bacterium GWF2_38_335]HBS88023.1 cytidine deaminase [Bacteroidales bacterium]